MTAVVDNKRNVVPQSGGSDPSVAWLDWMAWDGSDSRPVPREIVIKSNDCVMLQFTLKVLDARCAPIAPNGPLIELGHRRTTDE
jgi:hypothetical protein